jgi:hypothetical protein
VQVGLKDFLNEEIKWRIGAAQRKNGRFTIEGAKLVHTPSLTFRESVLRVHIRKLFHRESE